MKFALFGAAAGAMILCLSATPALAADAEVVIAPHLVKPGQHIRVTTKCPSLGYDSYTLSVDGKAWTHGRLIKGSGTGVQTAPKRRGGYKISGRCLPCPGSVAKPVGIRGAAFTVDTPKPKHRYPSGGVNTGFGGTSADPPSSDTPSSDAGVLGIAMPMAASRGGNSKGAR
jgi:hypothetical protein